MRVPKLENTHGRVLTDLETVCSRDKSCAQISILKSFYMLLSGMEGTRTIESLLLGVRILQGGVAHDY